MTFRIGAFLLKTELFKRFQVMDLYHSHEELHVNEWIPIEKNIPKENGIYKIKLSNENEITAYFCWDKCIGLIQYSGFEPSYWWDKQTKEPLYNVTYWGKDERGE